MGNLGLSGVNSYVISVTMENKRKDAALRRVRLVNRSGTGSAIKVVVPSEIAKIEMGGVGEGLVGIDFGANNATNSVKIEAKSDRGTYPFEFKIPPEESLRPLTLKIDEFLALKKR